MKATKSLICALTAVATLVAAAPVFADGGRDREHDSYRSTRTYGNYDRHQYRGGFRDFDRRYPLVVQRPMIVERPAYYARRYPLVVQRPMIVERPVYYAQPAPIAYGIGPGALIGAAIGSFIDYQRY